MGHGMPGMISQEILKLWKKHYEKYYFRLCFKIFRWLARSSHNSDYYKSHDQEMFKAEEASINEDLDYITRKISQRIRLQQLICQEWREVNMRNWVTMISWNIVLKYEFFNRIIFFILDAIYNVLAEWAINSHWSLWNSKLRRCSSEERDYIKWLPVYRFLV